MSANPQAWPRLRARESLARRLALVLLPLVLVPLVLLGGVAYLRARALLREQVHTEMTTATRSQMALLSNWSVDRQQQLTLAATRPELRSLLTSAERLAPSGRLSETVRENLRTQLTELRSQSGEIMFSDLLAARAEDGLILSATVPAWEGQVFPALANGTISASQTQTVPLQDDALVSPGTLTIATSVPIAPPGVVLVGLNSGLRLGQLLNELTVFAEARTAYRFGGGQTHLIHRPDLMVGLTGGGVNLTFRSGAAAHPLMTTKESDAPDSLEYVNLDGVAVLGAYQWMPGWDLAVVNELRQDHIYAGLASLGPFTVALIAITAVVTVAVMVLVTNRLLRPLALLTEFAGRISRGEWDSRVPEDRRDEIGLLASAFNRMADDLRGMYRTLEARVEERTRQVRTAAEVARAATSIPNLQELLRRAVELICERFGYYHAGIFLLDESGRNAVLREATGEAGAALVARRHSLPVGSQSIIGWVTANNQPRVASDVSHDPMHLKNELLPGTRAEAAVPLQVGGRMLGALDVQSLEPHAFSPEDLSILQMLADQLSAAIQNARLAERSALAAERARLISELTTAMAGQTDVERVLQTAGQFVHRALGQPEVVVRLVTSEDGGRVEEAATGGEGPA